MPHLLDHLLDVAGVAQNPLQTLHHIGVMADVALHDVHGVIENVVHRQRHGPVDRLDALRGRGSFLGDQQFQGVERSGDIAGENLQKLQVGLGKTTRLGAFHVERADHLFVQHQGNRERTLGALAALKVEGVFGGIGAEIAGAGGRHIAGHAIV